MQGQTVRIVSQAIRYIEEHLHEKMDLDMVASALHYSKYHLHRIFTKTVGLTIHDYAKRRQLTEAAKLLVFSAKPIIEIALMSGYESQQAFTDIFYDTKYDLSTEQINSGMHLCAKQHDDCIVAYAAYKECWQILNLETMDVWESALFKINKTEHKNLLECMWDNGEYDESFCESERLAICTLENYIKNVMNNDVGNKQYDIDKDSIGRKIYQDINFS